VQLDFNELRELLFALNSTDISELTLKSGDWELTVRKGMAVDRLSPALESALAGASAQSPPPPPTPGGEPGISGTAETAEAASSEGSAPPREPKGVEVTSPMVGTFYRAPSPDEPPFVDVGDCIAQGQTVCIIEAMKLMNEVEAEVSGEVIEILVENGEPVEFGQALMRVDPG